MRLNNLLGLARIVGYYLVSNFNPVLNQTQKMPGQSNKNLFACLSAAIKKPQAALIHRSDGSVITYVDMLERSAQFANVLIGLRVKPGDRIAVQIEKSIDALFLYLACLRVGGVYLPLNTDYTDKELGYFIEDAQPTVFVCSVDRKATLEEIAHRHQVAQLETLSGDAGSMINKANSAKTVFIDVPRAGDDLAAILYTSGTTGRSKGAMLTHDNLSSNANTLVEAWQFKQQDVLLHALPIYHSHGLFVGFNVVLMSGASMIFHSSFKVDDVLSALPRASVMMGVPTFYVRLLGAAALDRKRVGHIRLFVSGSAPLSPQTHQDFAKRTGHFILERYGMTETSMNISNPYVGERRPGTIGFALPGVEIRIADQVTGEPVVQGEVGMIEIRGPNVFKGYWNMPQKTAEEFRDDGFFISGDLGRMDKDAYISIVGRDKDLVISGGFNVYPAEVENAIDALDGIVEVAIIGAPHPDFGEGVTAIVVASNDAAPSAGAIKSQLANVLAKYKMPKAIFFVDALPRNKMGKVQKNQLRETYRNTYADLSATK